MPPRPSACRSRTRRDRSGATGAVGRPPDRGLHRARPQNRHRRILHRRAGRGGADRGVRARRRWSIAASSPIPTPPRPRCWASPPTSSSGTGAVSEEVAMRHGGRRARPFRRRPRRRRHRHRRADRRHAPRNRSASSISPLSAAAKRRATPDTSSPTPAAPPIRLAATREALAMLQAPWSEGAVPARVAHSPLDRRSLWQSQSNQAKKSEVRHARADAGLAAALSQDPRPRGDVRPRSGGRLALGRRPAPPHRLPRAAPAGAPPRQAPRCPGHRARRSLRHARLEHLAASGDLVRRRRHRRRLPHRQPAPVPRAHRLDHQSRRRPSSLRRPHVPSPGREACAGA